MLFAPYRTKVQMSTPFLRDRPWNFAHVFNVALSSLWLLLKFCFLWTIWDPLRPKCPEKYKNRNIWWREKTKENHSRKLRQEHIDHVCKISVSCLSKTAWTLDSQGIWDDKLEPACMTCRTNAFVAESVGLHSCTLQYNALCNTM